MDLFTSVLVKAISGILYVVYWLTWHLPRTAWWLLLYLILSLGAGVAWLARGGHGKPVDSGGFGHVLDDESGWQADDSGRVYPAPADDPESCTIEAELSRPVLAAHDAQQTAAPWRALEIHVLPAS